MADHDRSYKLLFSHPEMVRDLLAGFVQGDWVARLDLTTLERVSGTYVSDDLRGRASDLVWRARCGDRYAYVSIEFQSAPDPSMALRVCSYVLLLYQELLREKKISLTDGLPTVVPLVLYNGEDRWSAPGDLASLLCESLEGAEDFRPQHRYLLIDERHYDERELAGSQNLVAALFLLEHAHRPDQIVEMASSLMGRLASEGLVSLRRAFGVWLDRVSRARFARGQGSHGQQIWEMQSMLADKFDQWEAEFLQKGRQAGRQEGEATLLAHLLRKRFGDLPSVFLSRLGTAPAPQIERWSDRLFEASSLDEVFDAEQP